MTDAAAPATRARLPTSRVGLWVHGARPYSLVIALAPILLGVGYAFGVLGRVALWPVFCALVSALAIQVATNLANDAADGLSGADHPDRPGPPRLTGSGILSAREVQAGALVATLVAALFGLFAVVAGGWPILAIGLASILAGWGYSFGPKPISGSAWGEVFVVLFFGVLAVVGTVWLAAGVFTGAAALLGLGIGLPAAAVLTVNNHRDRVQDAKAGRNTLAMRLGPRWSVAFYGAQMVAASLCLAFALAPVTRFGALMLAATSALGLGMTWRLASTPISYALSARLAETAKAQMVLAVLAAVFLVVQP